MASGFLRTEGRSCRWTSCGPRDFSVTSCHLLVKWPDHLTRRLHFIRYEFIALVSLIQNSQVSTFLILNSYEIVRSCSRLTFFLFDLLAPTVSLKFSTMKCFLLFQILGTHFGEHYKKSRIYSRSYKAGTQALPSSHMV